MGSTVLSLRIDGELLDRIRQHAARSGMSVQDYVVRTLIRDDFDQRFKAAVDETEKFYGSEAAGTAGIPGVGAERTTRGPGGV
ncbi:ribbon-helix-helix protein, CopG family [Streptomyces sp. CB01580]|uniref:ribbon-helix-helix protein, CopG family n=1 Tax=Streptomyces sp. CB01580 TaxID=1703933 RepID=UPI00093A739D|nr:ribbon-helix-helix protein, CopG family [Streptomyces sp. CB01580]OKJ36470.1 hypothetical protein AMK22_15775 [Streptomyces sp. CB01580]